MDVREFRFLMSTLIPVGFIDVGEALKDIQFQFHGLYRALFILEFLGVNITLGIQRCHTARTC